MGEESKGEEKKQDIILERIYTIPLRIAYFVPRWKRTARAVRFVRDFLSKHMKSDHVVITPELNEVLWLRGAKRPLRRVRVRAVKTSEGIVKAYPFLEES
ncbi:MAG: 60S ribosomal protein L31 [Candidatus Methanomethylicia archaeon]|nr:60S ribosomal protein L31 [Candidatus Methanomethylicia archaeon]MCX8169298.1 60S ribosomal protein L31 [Candidatus Methanomethylicia archaeon]MDW7988919.1 50S ribosomal protein L31e [Nitrososphaerota archaeon]